MVLRPGRQAVYARVGDGISVAPDRPGGGARRECEELMLNMAQAWEEEGFVVNEKEVVEQGDKVVGYELQNFPPRVKLAGKKAVQLDAAMGWLLEVNWMDVESLRAAVGVWLWGALLRRELTSLPALIFEMLEKRPGEVVRWWWAAEGSSLPCEPWSR